VDGHDVAKIKQAIADLDTKSGPPHVILARTVFGKGVSFMERQLQWHYLPMSDDQYEQAMGEIGARR
jgi:transketolase